MSRSNDFLLRWHGFTIHSRPKSGCNLWKRNGRLYTEQQAVEVMLREQGRDGGEKKKLKGGL